MKAIIAILLTVSAPALAETANPKDQSITVYRAGKPTVYDANRKPYIDDRLRSHRLQEAPQPDGKAEKKDRALGIG